MRSSQRTATGSSAEARALWRAARSVALLLVGLVGGCRSGTLADPNDISAAGPKTAQVIKAQIEAASVAFNERKQKGELDDAQYHALLAQVADGYVGRARDRNITPRNASIWGDVLITARRWGEAEEALEAAVESGREPSKRDYLALGQYITDVLRLARVKAELGKVTEAVLLTRSVFDVPGKAKAPILPAVLYEIVPAGREKGHDLEMANLLKAAVAQHEDVIVDPNTDAGRNFLLARPHHIQKAWSDAALLYAAEGRQDLARDAMSQAERISGSSVRL